MITRSVSWHVIAVLLYPAVVLADDPLPSWHETATKKAIIEFVERVTDEESADYLPPNRRIATFDNDGCLWAEKPFYFQVLFAMDRAKSLAKEHPEWRSTEPYRSALNQDLKGVLAGGEKGLAKLMAATHAGVTAEEFSQAAKQWLAIARHPQTGKRYVEMVYQPMLELLGYLRAQGFKTFIVSGGGIDFLRVFAEQTYGIPPEQVVGSSIAAMYEMRNGVPTIVKQAANLFLDDKQGKPVGIYQHIGRRPVFAAGNSDGDLQMLQYTTMTRNDADRSGRLALLVHHTDANREWAYDRESLVGKLDQALDEAAQRGWVVVDMQRDWKTVFADSESDKK